MEITEKFAAMIYLDYAATTPMWSEVIEEMTNGMREYANPSAQYSCARKARALVDRARAEIAGLIRASRPGEIFFTSGGTESDDWAVIGAAESLPEDKRHIITSAYEHHAVLESMKELEKKGFSVSYLMPKKDGTISPDSVKKELREDTGLISIMLVNNETGALNDIGSISQIAHEKNVIVHTDAVQAVGHIMVDVRELGVDILSASAHKFGGPKGMGFLYVREGTMLHKLHFGGSQERGMRPGTENVNGIAGMAAAMRLSCSGYEEELTRLSGLRDMLIEGRKDSGLRYVLNSDPENSVPYILNVSFPGFRSSVTVIRADLEGICISAGAACSAGTVGESHVIKSMSRPKEVLSSAVRFSLGRQNTEKDMIRVAGFLKKLAASR